MKEKEFFKFSGKANTKYWARNVSINEERMKILQWNEWMNHESFILHGKIYIILEKNSYCDFCKFVNITSCVGLFEGVEFFW